MKLVMLVAASLLLAACANDKGVDMNKYLGQNVSVAISENGQPTKTVGNRRVWDLRTTGEDYMSHPQKYGCIFSLTLDGSDTVTKVQQAGCGGAGSYENFEDLY